MTTLAERVEVAGGTHPPQCSDFDKDCDEIEDKVHCWLYDPMKGFCPFLRARESKP